MSQTYLCKNLGIKRGGCIPEGGLLAGDLGIDLYMSYPQAPSLVAMEVTSFFHSVHTKFEFTRPVLEVGNW